MRLIDFWRARRKKRGQPCEVMPFHEEIADRLTRLALGTLPKPNLMILMPPRCGKTDLACIGFTEWHESWFPDSETIITSYGQDLATESVVQVRETLSAPWYRELVSSDWGAKLPLTGAKAPGRQDFFRTLQGGSVKGVGRGGSVTGFGAGKLREEFGGCIIIDDLLKAQEVRSTAARKEAWAYITGTLNSRRNRQSDPATPRLLIQQRLHPEDPAGMFLREERDEWDVLEIPAIENDKVIWPGRLDYEKLMLLQEYDPDTYWAQYQQKPQQDALRKILKEKWWRYWRDRATIERLITFKIITADTAFEEKTSADYTVFQCWGFVGTSGAILLDQDRGQWAFPDLVKHATDFKRKHVEEAQASRITPVSKFYIENKASGISLIQTLRREGIAVSAWEPKEQTAKDKVGRAKQAALPLAAGRIYIPDPTLPENKWVKNNYIPEANAFTDDDSHLNDDQVDAFTIAMSIWIEMGGATGPIPVY